jgi:ABC-type branched-subunit amino acid transport system substrate-binding protein
MRDPRPKTTRLSLLAGVAVGIVAASALAACSSNKSSDASATATANASAGASTDPSTGGGGSSSAGGGSGSGQYIIGSDISLTGSAGKAGQLRLDGIQAWVAGVNSRGGVNGHTVKLIVSDNRTTPAVAVQNVTQLANEKVSAIVGENYSGAWASLGVLLKRVNVATFGSSPPQSFLEPVQDYIYSSDANPNAIGRAQVDFIHDLVTAGKLPDNPRVALMTYDDAGGTSYAKTVTDYAKSTYNWTFVTAQTGDLGASSYSTQMVKVAGSHPDAVIVEVSDADQPTLLSGARSAGLATKTAVVSYGFASSPSTIKDWSDAGYKSYYGAADFKLATDFPQASSDFAKVQADTSQQFAAQGYGEGLIVQNVLQGCGYPCSASQFQAALQNTSTDLSGFAFGPVVYSTTSHYGPSTVSFRTDNPDGTGTMYSGGPITLKNS